MHDGFVLDTLINTHLPTIGTIRIYSVSTVVIRI